MPDYFVEARNLCKTIKGQHIVEDISFQMKKGSIAGLCGGNGAGKSTVLRMIAGIMQPSSGEITVNGLQWRHDRVRFAGQIGYMPDDYQFPQGMTAREILTFWAGLRKVSEHRVSDVLALVGLEDKGNKWVSAFSKGMRQRVLFAQAILAEPQLLIMDEPTNGLDPYWMKEFVRLVKSLRSGGQTVIFSTHQLDIAEELADEVLFLNEGRNCGEGSVTEYRQLFGDYPLHRAYQQLMELQGDPEREEEQ